MTTPTEDLLPAVARGDEGAVRDCIARYGGLVWSLARRACPTHAEAEDSVQEIFISLWRSAARFDAERGSEATFVATIARRRLIDRVRRVTRRPDGVLLEDVTGVSPQTAQGADDSRLANSEEAAIARRALETLSEDQQRVIGLSLLHGLSHEKIAQSTGIPLGTVKTHIRRGLIKVRDRIAQEKNASKGSASPNTPVGRPATDAGGPEPQQEGVAS